MADAVSLLNARIALWNRGREIKKGVIGAIKEVLGLQKRLGDEDRGLRQAEQELDRAEALGIYSKGSVDLIALENRLRSSARALELASAKLELSRAKLEDLVGEPVAEFLFEMPPARLEIPASFDIGRHPSVQTSRLAVEKADIALEEHMERFIPQYSVGVSYDVDSQTIGAGFTAGFENFSIGTSLSTDFGEALTASVTASWSLPDNRAKNLKTRELEVAREISLIEHESRLRKTTAEVESLKMMIREIEIRRISLEESIDLEELRLQDTRKRFELGMMSEGELSAKEWAVEKLSVDMSILRLDAFALPLAIEALVYE